MKDEEIYKIITSKIIEYMKKIQGEIKEWNIAWSRLKKILGDKYML